MIIKTKLIKVDTAGVSLRVAEGRLRLDLDGFFIRFPLFGEAFYSKDIGWVRKPWREVKASIDSWHNAA
jgi:hypothetical protein